MAEKCMLPYTALPGHRSKAPGRILSEQYEGLNYA